MPAPFAKGAELELRVDSLAYGGNGVARADRYVVFVQRGLPGDTVRARITKLKQSYAEAVTVAVVEPSPARVEAPCQHFPSCGGCKLQDLARWVDGTYTVPGEPVPEPEDTDSND